MFLFYGGYFACTMMALSAALTAFNWYYVPLVMVCEFALFLGVQARRGQLINVLEHPGGTTISFLFNVGFYLIMWMCPWVQLRIDDGNLGGRFYSTTIVYKLLSSAAIVMFATSKFASTDDGATKVLIEAATVRTMFFISLGVTITGMMIFLMFVTSSHRWTFLRSRWTGPEYMEWLFGASELHFDADTKDQQRTFIWLICHPSYLDQEKVKEWLLGLKSDGEILGGCDNKIPKGCAQFTGHSLDSFFTKSLQKIACYNGTEGFAEVKIHLDKLKAEVDERAPAVEVLETIGALNSTASIGNDTDAQTSFRRKSINDGIPILANPDDFNRISLRQVTTVSKANIGEVNQAFIDLVKGCGENFERAVGKFCDDVLPEGNELTRQILIDLASRIKPNLKLARIGLGARVLLSVVLTYMDLTTDFLVLKEYGEGGQGTRKYFHSSIGILAVSTLVNVLGAWIANKKKGTMAIGRGAVVAVMQLNPLVHGMNVWRGVENCEDDVIDPFAMFLMVRVSELIFEVMPETVLQLFVIYHAKKISWMSVFSILSSVASAAFIMTDNSMMYEKDRMVSERREDIPRRRILPTCFTQNKQKRGPHSHPIFGFIPSIGSHNAAVQLGTFLSFGGYLACSMIALSAALTAFNWYYIPLVMGCEFVVYVGVQASRGQLFIWVEVPGGKTLSPIVHVAIYLMMCICPWLTLRNEVFLGGRIYSTTIFYRLLSSASIVIFATSQFASIDGAREVTMSAETARMMFFIALGVTIVGATLFLTFITSSHRWTFYSSKWTGPDAIKWEFDAGQLLHGTDTKDQQRTVCWLLCHPNYLDQEKVKEWLLGLKSDGEILCGCDNKIPIGCGPVTGHTLDSFFTKSLQRYAHYNDTEGFPLVKAHLDKLKAEVDERAPAVEVIETIGAVNSTASIGHAANEDRPPSENVAEEPDDVESNSDSESDFNRDRDPNPNPNPNPYPDPVPDPDPEQPNE